METAKDASLTNWRVVGDKVVVTFNEKDEVHLPLWHPWVQFALTLDADGTRVMQ